MSCSLEVSGHIAIGGGGSSCCGDSGGAGKYQPIDFGCGVSYSRVQSTDCSVRIGSTEEPLPASAGIESAELLFVRSASPFVLKFGGSAPAAKGETVSEPISFSGSETFSWRVVAEGGGVLYTASAAFSSGSKTLAQIQAVLNAAAVAGGADVLPVSRRDGALELEGPLGPYAIEVLTALSAIGFPSTGELAKGDSQTSQSVTQALIQTERGAGLRNLRCIGPADVTVMVAGS